MLSSDKPEVWDRWHDGVYACDKCLVELVKKPDELVCQKCQKSWKSDPIKGVRRNVPA